YDQSGSSATWTTLFASKNVLAVPISHITNMNPKVTRMAAIALRVYTATTVETAYRMANVNVRAKISSRNDGSHAPDRAAITSQTPPIVNADSRKMNVSPPMYL